MQLYFGVFREGNSMHTGLEKLEDLKEQIEHMHLRDKSRIFNTSRIEALELSNLFAVAQATAITAEHRKESRGAHARSDFEKRDDENWMKHSLFFEKDKRVTYRAVNFSPESMDPFPPTARTY